MRFVLATANPGKINEMQSILSGLGAEVVTRNDLGIEIDIEETGTTFFENALIKAKAICALTGLPSIADDSGLIIDALGGRPGVFTSTFGGESLSDSERCLYLLKEMEGMEQRSAKFVSTIVCAFPDGSTISAEGECLGEIMRSPSGSGGFGYDPVFIAKGNKRTMAQLTDSEKNSISHRGSALRKFSELLHERKYL